MKPVEFYQAILQDKNAKTLHLVSDRLFNSWDQAAAWVLHRAQLDDDMHEYDVAISRQHPHQPNRFHLVGLHKIDIITEPQR